MQSKTLSTHQGSHYNMNRPYDSQFYENQPFHSRSHKNQLDDWYYIALSHFQT